MLYYNGERYRDPTAGEALANIERDILRKKTEDIMPKTITPIPYAAEVDELRKILLKAEEKLIDIIGLKRKRELVSYAEELSLSRVQRTLQGLIDDSWEYVPKMIEHQYLLGKRREMGIKSAIPLTVTEHNVIGKLVNNLMGTLTEAAVKTSKTISETWREAQTIARLESDTFRTSLLEGLVEAEATGGGLRSAKAVFLEKMEQQGISAFTDKTGRNWSLSSYGDMATRTTSRQAANMGTLFADEEHDLYMISSHGSTCPVCAPLEGRVYSRSGNDKDFPPLAEAFGKIDPKGGNGLDNTYLNIHPNCRHVLIKYTDAGRSKEEQSKIRDFSSFEKNPPTRDPRSEAQIAAYRKREQARSKLLNEHKQFERYRTVLSEDFPKTFQTFQKHKLSNSDKYQKWQTDFRKTNRLLKQGG